MIGGSLEGKTAGFLIKVEELSPTSIVQQVLIVGPDGKDYEAVYTLILAGNSG